jgi:hypothetical protein
MRIPIQAAPSQRRPGLLAGTGLQLSSESEADSSSANRTNKTWQSRCADGDLLIRSGRGNSSRVVFESLMMYPCEEDTPGNQFVAMRKITQFG